MLAICVFFNAYDDNMYVCVLCHQTYFTNEALISEDRAELVNLLFLLPKIQ